MQLRRDRGAFLLVFVLPVVFFTIFALIFGRQQNPATSKVSVIVVDQDRSALSQRFVAGLQREPSLNTITHPKQEKGQSVPADYDATGAEAAVKGGVAPAAIIIPKGFGDDPIAFGPGGSRTKLLLLHDRSDPVAAPMVSGLLQKVMMTALPDSFAETGMKFFELAAGGLSAAQRRDIEDSLAAMRKSQDQLNQQPQSVDSGRATGFGGLIGVDVRDVVGQKKRNPVVAFQVAAIAVMFLLFTSSGAAGTLLDESETGALDRMLSARVSMAQLLAGKLIYCMLLGCGQLAVMFVWAAIVFHLELASHLAGFIVMSISTGFAAAAFGLLLATTSRSRAAQQGIATLIILTMSSIGGSMIPRFMMPASIQKLGLITYNAWAIDGFTKVFWRDEPISHLLPQIGFLLAWTLVMFLIARRFARRWESA